MELEERSGEMDESVVCKCGKVIGALPGWQGLVNRGVN